MKIKVIGLKRSEGKMKTERGEILYAGWRTTFSYASLDPEFIGEEVSVRSLSDKLLNGIVPQPGDEFDIVVDLEGRVKSIKPILPSSVLNKSGGNYSNTGK